MESGSAEANPQQTAAAPAWVAGMSPLATLTHPKLIEVTDLAKEYLTGRGKLVLFEHLTFSVEQGDLLAIVGQSGAGKSTLLHILAALDTPSGGEVYCASSQLRLFTPRQAASFRNREINSTSDFFNSCTRAEKFL